MVEDAYAAENEELNLVEFYSKLLSSTGLIVQPDGAVLFDDGGGPRPLTINNAVLFLPTQDLLKSGNLNGKVVFHPVWENAVRKESVVFKRLAEFIRTKLHITTITLLQTLTMYACDPGKQSLLSPEQSNYLSLMPDANDKTLEAVTSVLDLVSGGAGGKKLITFFMKRHGIYEGREVRRLAKVAFPILDERTTTTKTIFGVKMSQRYKDEIFRLFEFIFPDCDKGDTYSFGTDELLAPNFTALMGAYYKLATRLNFLVDHFRNVLADPHELYINLNWYPSMKNIQKYRISAPAFPGNEGETVDGQEDTAAPGPVAGQGAAAPTLGVAPQATAAQPNTPAPLFKIDKSKLFGDVGPVKTAGVGGQTAAAPLASKAVFEAGLPKWTDHANKLVSAGLARPANPVEDALLNNHGATQVIVVDQNGNPVNAVNAQQLAQQALMNQQKAQYWQMFVMQAPSLNINLAAMSADQQQLAFQMWYQMNSGGNNGMQANNGMAFNNGFPQSNGFPMNNNMAFGGNANVFGQTQSDPFALPGRAAAENAKRMSAFQGNGNFNAGGFGNNGVKRPW